MTAWLGRAVWLMVGLGVLAVVFVGANRPARPSLVDTGAVTSPSSPSPASLRPSRVPGFNEVRFRIIGKRTRPGCALAADSPSQQTQGLTGRHDLADYDAMVFRFGSDVTVPFFDKGVPLDLSIAWFDAAGVYVGQRDLARCSAACPLVGPGEAFRYAVETPKGGLGHLGIGPHTVLLVGGACV